VAGDKVVARFVWQVRGRASGLEMAFDAASVNTIRGGRIVRQEYFFDYVDALEAVGLSE
jgi:ketosteroid isomerase-like protein